MWSTSAGSGARLRASTAVYSAREPLRVQSVSPNTRWPTVRPVVPYPNLAVGQHTPAGTPRGRIPLGRRQSGYPVGELDAKAANFSPGIHARGGHLASLAEVDRVGP